MNDYIVQQAIKKQAPTERRAICFMGDERKIIYMDIDFFIRCWLFEYWLSSNWI